MGAVAAALAVLYRYAPDRDEPTWRWVSPGAIGASVLFVAAYSVLIGAQLNAESERQTVHDGTEGGPEPMGRRGAHAADTVGPTAGEGAGRRGR